jgi:hypothetical protein
VREGHRDGGHAAALHDEEQRPSVEEGDQRVIRVAKIGVLSADSGTQRGELGVDERADQGDHPAGSPEAENERWRAHLPRDDRRVHEDPGADDSSHHDHRRVERAETARQCVAPVERRWRDVGCMRGGQSGLAHSGGWCMFA